MEYNKALEETIGILLLLPQLILVDFFKYIQRFGNISIPRKEKFEELYVFDQKRKPADYFPKEILLSENYLPKQESSTGLDEQPRNDETITVPHEEPFCGQARSGKKGLLKQEINTKIQKDLGIGERRARGYGKLFCERFGGQVRSISNIRASYTASGEVCISYIINNRRYRLNLGSESPYKQLKNMNYSKEKD